MASGYEILLNARLQTQSAEKTYETWKTSIQKKPINFEMTINTDGLKNVKSQLSTIQTQIDNFTNSSTNSFTKMTKALATVTTETDKYRLSNDGLRTVITKTNEAGQKFRTITDEVVNTQGSLVTTTQNLVQVQNGSLKYWKQQGETVKDVVTDYAAASDETKNIKQKIEELNKTEQENIKNTQQMGSSMQNASVHAQTLGEKIVTAAGKVALFKVSTTIVMAFYNTIDEAKNAILEFDEALTEFKKVSELSGQALGEYTKKLGELGETVARTRKFHCGYVQQCA